MSKAKSAEKVVQDIRRKTRRRFSAEEKIRIVLESLPRRGEHCRPLSARRSESESVLPLEQGVPRSQEAAAGWGHDP